MNAPLIRFAALSALLFAGAQAHAQDATTTPEHPAMTESHELPPYESLDANGDGVVTLPEIVVHSPPLARRIKHCDANGDEKLSRAEYAGCKPKDVSGKAISEK